MPTLASIRLGPKDRQRLAALAGLDTETAKADLDRLERILDDHGFITDVFERPKPNAVRDLIAPRKGAGLKKKAKMLADALDDVPWQVSGEFKAHGVDLHAFRRELKRFIAASDDVLASYAGEKTPRRDRQHVRDRHIIPAIADLFDHMCGREADAERDWEHIDDQCTFVAYALECAGIPCPDAGDTRLGEERQGRLRRLLKKHDTKNRQNTARRSSRLSP